MMASHKILPYSIEKNVLILTPTGDSLGVEERVLKNEIAAVHKKISSSKIDHLVVDVGKTAYFGSLMMGALIALCKRATDTGGKATICNASEGMLESIQIMKLDTVIPYHNTREEAMAFVNG